MRSTKDILRQIRPELELSASDDLLADGMLDSLDVITLVSELDKTHGISIAGVDVVPDNFRSFAAIEALLSRYKRQSGSLA